MKSHYHNQASVNKIRMWFLFILIQTHFHSINKRNFSLWEINWLSVLIYRTGKMRVISHKVIHRWDKLLLTVNYRGMAGAIEKSIKKEGKLLLRNWYILKRVIWCIPIPHSLWVLHTLSSHFLLSGRCTEQYIHYSGFALS